MAILFPLHRMPCRHCGTLTFQDPLQMIPSVKSSRLTIKFNHGLSRLSHWLSKSVCGTEDKCSVLLLVALSKPLSTLKESSLDIPQRRADTATPRNCLMCQFASGKSSRGEREKKGSRHPGTSTGVKGTTFQTNGRMKHPHCVYGCF